jgi:hypothetical protein
MLASFLSDMKANKHLSVVWLSNGTTSLFVPKFSHNNKPLERYRPQNVPTQGRVLYLPKVNPSKIQAYAFRKDMHHTLELLQANLPILLVLT